MSDEFINERTIWQYGSTNSWYDGDIEVAAHASGVLVSVEQEHAVDSYNSSFTSQVLIPWSKWDEMVAAVAEVRPAQP